MTKFICETKNLSKKYKDFYALKNVNLTIPKGEIYGLVGENGAGKTTTIKMITGILDIDEGDILIDGNSIKTNPLEAKKRFGLVPDNPDIFIKLKGIEYLNFIADIYKISEEERIEKIKNLSKQFEMENVLNNKIQSYSHGMRQKIVIMGTLLHDPQNLILDEPMTGLDPRSSFDLKRIMREHTKQNKSVFFSTHILEVAERLCDRVGIINRGKLVFIGTYEEMKREFNKKASLEELFMEITDND